VGGWGRERNPGGGGGGGGVAKNLFAEGLHCWGDATYFNYALASHRPLHAGLREGALSGAD